MPTYAVDRDPRTGKVTGVLMDGASKAPADPDNADWRAFLAWNAAQATPLSLANGPPTVRTRRSILAIRNDIAALTGPQKNTIWANFTAGTPPLWSTNVGANFSAMVVLRMLGASGTMNAADVLEAKHWAVAMYCQDNPTYLVHPSFDATINIAGDA